MLAFTNQNAITGSWDSVNGILSLTGTSSVGNYETALRLVTYENTSDNPSTAQRTIRFAVHDGNVSSNTQSRNINVGAFNDAPSLDLDADNSTATGTGYAAAFIEAGAGVAGSGQVPVVDTDVLITDADNATMATATVTLTNAPDGAFELLAFVGSPPSGITVAGSGSTAITLTGPASLADFQTALKQIFYNNFSGTPDTTPRSVTVVVNDGTTSSNTATATISVTASNDAPV